MKVAIIGYGGRGHIYARYFQEDERVQIVAVCEKKPQKIQEALEDIRGLTEKDCYLKDEEFFAQGQLADLLVVSTQDADHFGHAMKALEVGYDLLLEKPISDSLDRCLAIYQRAKALGRKVFICHVLRYAPFFEEIKRELDTGKYGKISTINLTENVGFWHQAHSYVRGNWSVTEKSTPMILAKCCHDLDIISWLMGDNACKAVSSFGSLDFFTPENAPENSAEYCFACKNDDCPYNSVKFYRTRAGMFHRVCENTPANATPEEVEKALSDTTNPYARCVFHCDNTAVDHQVVNMVFENRATAHLTMTAFAKDSYREIHVHCTHGDIRGDMLGGKLECNFYGLQNNAVGETQIIDLNKLSDGDYSHGGGDARLVRDVIRVYMGEAGKGLTTIENSFISHSIGYAAEQSRLQDGAVVKVKALSK